MPNDETTTPDREDITVGVTLRGEVRMTSHHWKIIIDFTAQEARTLANALIECAQFVEQHYNGQRT